ncbi:hypothetical protein T4E_9302 [Trichinella pseudospiralis]|uniref:Uncharacterized protein n=1 Tax=Trichinella pseudospiralis TaxID=6337 RepID=A0A0V0YMR7_TRIPS|nr:hypothetical protein T4E_9302 [Trichinella pseudospiralis]
MLQKALRLHHFIRGSWSRDAESATPMTVHRRTLEMDIRLTEIVGLTLPSSIKASPKQASKKKREH